MSKILSISLLIILIVLLSINFILPGATGNSASNPEDPVPHREPGDIAGMHGDRPDRSNGVGFQAGINLLVYGEPDLLRAKILFKHLKELGLNSLAIAYPLAQAGWQANEVTVDPTITPDESTIRALIRSAKANNFTIMLRPILDEKYIRSAGRWRGSIEPGDTEAWFASYRSLILLYALLAQEEGVDIFNMGTELNSLQRNLYLDEWTRLIGEIREVYRGDLIYSFNWDCYQEIPSIGFVPMLDYIGIDAYFPLDVANNAGVKELEEAWKVWTDEIKKIATGKILITEAGIIPSPNAYVRPYVWSIPGEKPDPAAQANYYEATSKAWRFLTAGIYWWCVTLDQPDSLYSPLGTPTEEVLKRHYLD